MPGEEGIIAENVMGRVSARQAALLSAMGNEKRLLILQILLEGEITVTALAERVGLSQSALSQHLAKLRDEAMVTTRREAQTVYYTTQDPRVLAILNTLEKLF